MRFSLRKFVLSCLLVTLVFVLDVVHRSIRRELQHSDTLGFQRVQQRDVSAGEQILENGAEANNRTRNSRIITKRENRSIRSRSMPIDDNHRADNQKKKRNSTLDDIFISVKTTKNFHESRVSLQLETWFNLAKEQVRTNYIKCQIQYLLL